MSNFNMFHRLLALGATAGASLVLPAAASAQQAVTKEGLRTEVVSYADLNLANAAGQRALARRIYAAAEHVCGPMPDRASMFASTDYRSCLRTAQQGALKIVTASTHDTSATKLAQLGPNH